MKLKRLLSNVGRRAQKGLWLAAALGLVLAPGIYADSVPPVTATVLSDFVVDYNGFINGGATIIQGLTGKARFYNFSFQNGIGSHSGQTLISFSIDLTNNSSSPITGSRISGLDFDTTPNIATSGNTVSGVFDTVVTKSNSNLPNVGHVELCFTDVNCAGGGSGGVTQGNTGTLTANLYFIGGGLSSVTFDNFYDRYQSITGPCSGCGGSASGAVAGAAVPEPSQIPTLMVFSAALVLFARQRMVRSRK